jgi:hypothetical protein
VTRTRSEGRHTARAAALAFALALAAGGCGGDGEPEERAPAADRVPVPTKPPPSESSRERPERGENRGEESGSARTTPEPAPGGAAGEEPVRTEVELGVDRAGVRPARVKVAPFVAVRVTLRQDDGGRYVLAFGTRRLTVDARRPVARLLLRGLPAGGRHVGRPVAGTRRGARITASAEPGP